MGSDKQPSVLVVDDEPSLVRVVEGYLTTDGFTVRTAGDGETALALARESEPDVVVLDLGLPGMDGVEVCRQLRTFSSCYVLMLTARADEVDLDLRLVVLEPGSHVGQAHGHEDPVGPGGVPGFQQGDSHGLPGA